MPLKPKGSPLDEYTRNRIIDLACQRYLEGDLESYQAWASFLDLVGQEQLVEELLARLHARA